MSSEHREERIMKKLAIIVIAVIGLGTIAVSQAAGMSPSEHRALMLRSEGLNQMYGLGVPVKGENYYARGLPSSTPTTFASAPSTSTDFQWGDAGIGAGALLGLMGLAAGVLGLRRHRLHLGTS
jgi:hypothetical protein